MQWHQSVNSITDFQTIGEEALILIPSGGVEFKTNVDEELQSLKFIRGSSWENAAKKKGEHLFTQKTDQSSDFLVYTTEIVAKSRTKKKRQHFILETEQVK